MGERTTRRKPDLAAEDLLLRVIARARGDQASAALGPNRAISTTSPPCQGPLRGGSRARASARAKPTRSSWPSRCDERGDAAPLVVVGQGDGDGPGAVVGRAVGSGQDRAGPGRRRGRAAVQAGDQRAEQEGCGRQGGDRAGGEVEDVVPGRSRTRSVPAAGTIP